MWNCGGMQNFYLGFNKPLKSLEARLGEFSDSSAIVLSPLITLLDGDGDDDDKDDAGVTTSEQM
jgi:hypothetical protein